MTTRIAVKDGREAQAVRVAMADPQVRAFVVVMGTLLQLKTDAARRRVLTFVADQCAEEGEVTR